MISWSRFCVGCSYWTPGEDSPFLGAHGQPSALWHVRALAPERRVCKSQVAILWEHLAACIVLCILEMDHFASWKSQQAHSFSQGCGCSFMGHKCCKPSSLQEELQDRSPVTPLLFGTLASTLYFSSSQLALLFGSPETFARGPLFP